MALTPKEEAMYLEVTGQSSEGLHVCSLDRDAQLNNQQGREDQAN